MFFCCVKRLGMTTMGMPGHGFTFPVGGIVPVLFSSVTVTQLLNSVNDWDNSRNRRIPTAVIFLDLAKAFDSVPHGRLLLNLGGYGIDSVLLARLRDCLTH